MELIQVWNYTIDENLDYDWTLQTTAYETGSPDELLFWRVMSDSGVGLKKSFFNSPEDYATFSGTSIYEFKEQACVWHTLAHKD
jgi:hypothetical protein